MAATKAAIPASNLSPAQQADALERQAAELRKPKPVEFPKMVCSKSDKDFFLTFNSRKEQDAAGPDFADPK